VLCAYHHLVFSCQRLFQRKDTCSAGNVSEYFGSESPNRGIFSPTTSRILIYSDVEFLMSILIQVLVDAREVQPSLIPLLQLHPHADHHALRRAGSLT